MWSSSLRNHRVWWVVLSTAIALTIAAVGSYYVFVTQDNDFSEQNFAQLPAYAVGATVVVWTHAYIGQPDDYSSYLKDADIVVEGVIDELYPARWFTADGTGLETLTEDDLKNPDLHVRTPVQLSVKRVFKGESVGDTLKFSFIGGRVGDTAYVFEGNESYEEGAQVILFLKNGAVGFSPRAYLLVKGDVAQGPIKDIPMEDLLRQLQ